RPHQPHRTPLLPREEGARTLAGARAGRAPWFPVLTQGDRPMPTPSPLVVLASALAVLLAVWVPYLTWRRWRWHQEAKARRQTLAARLKAIQDRGLSARRLG